jgi:predicted amidohydrolase YtcJ
MNRCGINENTISSDGGEIGRTDGKINGLLFENALALVNHHLPKTSSEDYQSMIRSGAKKMLEAGITSITDPAVHPELMEAYHQTAGRSLGLRLNLMPMMMPDGGDKIYPLPPVEKGLWKRITIAKLFADGGLSGATAALNRNYRGNRGKGILRINDERLIELVRNARAAGYSTGIHAIGDRAISQVLSIYRKTTKEFGPCRNRIEHFGLPSAQDLEDAAQMNVIAVPQAIFLDELGENFVDALDETYLSSCYPLKSLVQRNIPWAMSTDAPVVKNFSPWKNIQTAITRKTSAGNSIAPHESINIRQALEAYTSGSAFAEGTENFKGTISEGKVADFIITDRNPFETPVEEITEIQVLSTYTGGEEVFKK